MRTLYHPTREEIRLSTVLYALSDPIRLTIVQDLADKEETSCSGFGFEVPKSTLSHHFKVLREGGVVNVRVEGTTRYVSIRREDLNDRFPGLLNAVFAATPPF
jgi:DNA-binding transcriptional ArsR family regulator